MTLIKRIKKREIKVCYDDDGVCKGGEVRQVVQVLEGGNVLAESKEELVPIAGALQQGITVEEAMSSVQSEAVAATETAIASRDEQQRLRERAEADIAKRDERIAKIGATRKDYEVAMKHLNTLRLAGQDMPQEVDDALGAWLKSFPRREVNGRSDAQR